MSDYYLFRKYGVCALSQKRNFIRTNYCKAMTSSRMYRIFVILAILMTSSSDDVIKFSNFEFCNSFTFIVWSYCEKIKCLSLTTLKLLLFTFWIFFRFEPILKILVSTIFLWKIMKKIFISISSWNFRRMF